MRIKLQSKYDRHFIVSFDAEEYCNVLVMNVEIVYFGKIVKRKEYFMTLICPSYTL